MANEKKANSLDYDISEILNYASKVVADQKLVTGKNSIYEKNKKNLEDYKFIIKYQNDFGKNYSADVKSGYFDLLRNEFKKITDKNKDSRDINSIFKDAFKESKKIR